MDKRITVREDDLLSHVEDDARSGAFMLDMQAQIAALLQELNEGPRQWREEYRQLSDETLQQAASQQNIKHENRDVLIALLVQQREQACEQALSVLAKTVVKEYE